MPLFPPGFQSFESSRTITPRQALITQRVIWGALLMGQFSFMAVLAVMIAQPRPKNLPVPDPRVMQILLIVNVLMLMTVIPVAGLVRRWIFQRNRMEGLVALGAYGTGNIIFWAACETVTFMALIIALLNRSMWPTVVIVAVAAGTQILSYPRRSAIIPK